MARCKNCNSYCPDQYTYCKKCYYELGEPKGMASQRVHKCKKCGLPIKGRYMYCMSCAKRNGYL